VVVVPEVVAAAVHNTIAALLEIQIALPLNRGAFSCVS